MLSDLVKRVARVMVPCLIIAALSALAGLLVWGMLVDPEGLARWVSRALVLSAVLAAAARFVRYLYGPEP